MKSIELLAAIGEVRNEYIQDILIPAQPKENKTVSGKAGAYTKKASVHRFRRLLLAAAIIALMLLLMGCAVVIMRLQHLTIRDEAMDTPSVTLAADVPIKPINLISIQGYMGSNSYEAFKEWQEFLAGYDPDGSIRAVCDDFQKPEAYFSYSCYSQEMVDKLEEICEKYGLAPLGKPWFYSRAEDVFEAVGIESAFADTAQTEAQNVSGYCYKDGTFHLEGAIELSGEWDELVSFDYRSVQKTSFDGVARNIGDVEDYDQWDYTMRDGTRVLLALKEDGGLIIAEKEDSFVTVAALGVFANGGNFGKLPNHRAFLEAFCEAFDFTYQTQPVDAGKAEALYQAQENREDRYHVSGGLIDSHYLSSYAAWIEYMVKEQQYKDLEYALMDLNGDGVEELLLQSKSRFRYNGDKNSFFSLLSMRDGTVQRLIEGSNNYICAGNVIEFTMGGHFYHTLDMTGERFEFIVGVDQFAGDDQYYRNDKGLFYDGDPLLTKITQEEAQAIIAKYPHVDIAFKPVSDFPAN